MVTKIINHSNRALRIAAKHGWLPGARYTNLRDVRNFDRIGLLDIDWTNYDFHRHLEAAKLTRPFLTVARDIEDSRHLRKILDQAEQLTEYASHVVIVPKDSKLRRPIEDVIPSKFVLGYSVPSKYGTTSVSTSEFRRPVHLLGGRPDVQRVLAESLSVMSLDCNRFTLDASFGDYFDGKKFVPHPVGGYERCIEDSIININSMWDSYKTRFNARSIFSMEKV